MMGRTHMSGADRGKTLSVAALGAAIVAMAGQSAHGQPDLTGIWGALLHEDYWYRFDGPDLGDYGGLPLTEKAREMADAHDPNGDYYFLPENQCKPHGAAYVMRGPGPIRILYEDDGNIAIDIQLDAQVRRIYMDGRPWPGGELQWQGHSVGRWEGETLTAVTTRMRPRYLRRNGVTHSEDAVMTEHFVRHGDILTVISIVEDAEFLTEPLVRSVSFRKWPDDYDWQSWECYPIDFGPAGVPGEH